MAGSNTVWGIDIGQCSLKALRCRTGDAGHLVAEAFDYIAYPKILSQPGAEPAELIREALAQFLSRNTVRGDRVAVSVPGQSGLARFIKLPPVELKKIPDIVRYEARQQIPFDLADVIWDYQRMGGAEEEGFALETEVGLFAMKRDQVYRALEPFTAAGIEVDVVQLTPLALFNFLLFDKLHDLPPLDQYDPDDPPASTVILSLGTDATDLVVTNGYRVWQRSIPLGGNHFTKALTKELKLTFAKAEHLKCNAASAPDPRALFQAMRPVFNDLLTEIQRSIGYFTSIERRAKIERILTLGNAMKMPGLRRYLAQSLGVEVVRLDGFERLSGPEVLGAPAFKENMLSFGVAYGLAVQALGVGRGTLRTNLLPREIIKDRFVRSKKPWALAAAAVLLLGCAIGYAGRSMALVSISGDDYSTGETALKTVASRSGQLVQQEQAAKDGFDTVFKTAQHLVGNVDNRVLWLELLRAVNECLPHDKDPLDKRIKEKKDIHLWDELHIESIQCQQVDDLATQWWPLVQGKYEPAPGEAPSAAAPAADPTAAAPLPVAPVAPAAPGAAPPVPPADPSASPTSDPAATAVPGPTGPGWVIQLKGYHFHNPEAASGGVAAGQYVRETFIRNVQENTILLPTVQKEDLAGGEGKKEPQMEPISLKDLGIGFPTLVWETKPQKVPIADPFADAEEGTNGPKAGGPGAAGPTGEIPGMPMGGRGGIGGPANPTGQKMRDVRRVDFVVQFCWKPTPPTVRQENKVKAQSQPANASGDAAPTVP